MNLAVFFQGDFEGLTVVRRLTIVIFVMFRIKLLIAILIMISVGTNAQSIKGRLLDLNENRPLRGATLTLTSLKDSLQNLMTFSIASEDLNLPTSNGILFFCMLFVLAS